MARKYKPKTTRKRVDKALVEQALNLISTGTTIRQAGLKTGVPQTTLRRFVTKSKEDSVPLDISILKGNDNRRVFTHAQEESLVNYILDREHSFGGFTPDDLRVLAFETAKLNQIKVPDNWYQREKSGTDWLYSFRRRYPQLSHIAADPYKSGSTFDRSKVDLIFDSIAPNQTRRPSPSPSQLSTSTSSSSSQTPSATANATTMAVDGKVTICFPKITINHPAIGELDLALPTLEFTLPASDFSAMLTSDNHPPTNVATFTKPQVIFHDPSNAGRSASNNNTPSKRGRKRGLKR